MSKIFLIGVDRIKAESVIEENIDDKVLSKGIMMVQEIQLKAILGDALYDKVIQEAQLKAGNTSYVMSPLIKKLIDDYIQPYLIHATVADFIAVNNYKISNKGVQKLNDNSSTSVGSSELEYFKNYYDNYTSTFKRNLIRFLADNSLQASNTDVNVTSPATGWYIESSNSTYDNNNTSAIIIDEPSANIETDPIWTNEKFNYYTKSQIDNLLLSVKQPSYISNETPAGLQNGVNINYTTAYHFVTDSTRLYLNGQRLHKGYANDYYEQGNQMIIFRTISPINSDVIIIDYLTNDDI